MVIIKGKKHFTRDEVPEEDRVAFGPKDDLLSEGKIKFRKKMLQITVFRNDV